MSAIASMVADDRTYVVRGHWPFPSDMLRRDGSRPATERDRIAIERLSGDSCEDRADFQDVDVSLIGPSDPNTERWESFGWKVPDDAMHAFVKAGRERAAKEGSVIASALAKLDPEERALIESRMGCAR